MKHKITLRDLLNWQTTQMESHYKRKEDNFGNNRKKVSIHTEQFIVDQNCSSSNPSCGVSTTSWVSQPMGDWVSSNVKCELVIRIVWVQSLIHKWKGKSKTKTSDNDNPNN